MVLEVLISGLVAFVKQSCVLNDAKAVHVLMMEGHPGHAHNPRLMVDVGDLVPFAPKDVDIYGPDEIIQLPNNVQMAVWDLTKRRVRIVNAPPIGIYEGHRNPNVYLPDPYNNPPNDFSWAPELHRACDTNSDNAKPKEENLDDKKLASYANSRLVPLKVLKPSDINTKLDMLEAVIDDAANAEEYTFNANYHQALADGAKLTLHFDADPVEIDLESYVGKKTRKIRLKPRVNLDLVSVLISNLPMIVEPVSNDPLTHFESYFELLQPANHPRKCTPPTPKGQKRDLLTSAHPVKCTICVDCGP